MRGVGIACVSLLLCAVASDATAAPKKVLVVGEAGAAEAVTRRGHQVVEPTGVKRVLGALRDRAEQAQRAGLGAVTRTLAKTQDLYLEQEFGAMVELLDQLATAHRWLLSSSDQRELAWAVAFRQGLARLSRGDKGDRAEAARHFALAIAILFEKRPASDLYGPDVATAFGEAVAARERLAPRPVTIRTEPEGALVVVDGFPGLGNRRNLRPGLHLVRVSAPGYLTRAERVEISAGGEDPPPIELEADTGAGPVDRWTVAELAPGRPAFDEFWRSMLAESNADAVLWVGKSRAHVVTAERVSAPATGASPRAAAAAALDDWLGAPRVATASRPLTSRPLFWAGAVVVAAVVITGVVLIAGGDGGDNGGGGGITVGVVNP